VPIGLSQVRLATVARFTHGHERVERSFGEAQVPDTIPREACYLGWQESLTLLEQLVEAEIPG
jgi:hypothetical protein